MVDAIANVGIWITWSISCMGPHIQSSWKIEFFKLHLHSYHRIFQSRFILIRILLHFEKTSEFGNKWYSNYFK